MKTCEALRSEGFHSVATIEFRLRTINYAEVQLEVPDFGSDPAVVRGPAGSSGAGATRDVVPRTRQENDGSRGSNGEDAGRTAAATARETDTSAHDKSSKAAAVSSGAADNTPPAVEADGVSDENVTNGKGCLEGCDDGSLTKSVVTQSGEVATSCNGQSGEGSSTSGNPAASGLSKRPREEAGDGGLPEADELFKAGRGRNERLQPKAAMRAAAAAAAAKGGAGKAPVKLVCAQPYPTMRGHTAFLTFATTPVQRRPAVAVTVEAMGVSAAAESASSGCVHGESNPSNGGSGMDVVRGDEEGEGTGTEMGAEKTAAASVECAAAVSHQTGVPDVAGRQ